MTPEEFSDDATEKFVTHQGVPIMPTEGNIDVDADSPEEAIQKVEQMYEFGKSREYDAPIDVYQAEGIE